MTLPQNRVDPSKVIDRFLREMQLGVQIDFRPVHVADCEILRSRVEAPFSSVVRLSIPER